MNDALILLEKVISKDIDKPKRNYLINNNCVMRHIKVTMKVSNDNIVYVFKDGNKIVDWNILNREEQKEILTMFASGIGLFCKSLIEK